MKNLITKHTLIILIVLTSITSCGSDNDPINDKPVKDNTNPVTLSVEDFNKTVDEASLKNGEELGTLKATSKQGDITYNLESQTPKGAIALSKTGVVTVADALSFDFEINPTITALVKVKSGSVTKEIKIKIILNDIIENAILLALSDSKVTYEKAKDGDWISISEKEYKKLSTDLKETSIVGTPDMFYPSINQLLEDKSNITYVTPLGGFGNRIPANAYVVAFKYSPKQLVVNAGSYVKINSSTDYKVGYSNLGGYLPTHFGGNSHAYFVLKGNTIKNSSESYLAAYINGKPGYINGSYPTYYKPIDANKLTDIESRQMYLLQGLATTKKQW